MYAKLYKQQDWVKKIKQSAITGEFGNFNTYIRATIFKTVRYCLEPVIIINSLANQRNQDRKSAIVRLRIPHLIAAVG